MPNPNIWKIAKEMGLTWKKWQSWNPKWRPRRTLRVINEELEKLWYEPATFDDIKNAYLYLLQLPVDEIKRLVNKRDTPILIKIVAKALSEKKWFDIIEKMLDRAIWKAVQQINSKIELWWSELKKFLEEMKEKWWKKWW